MDIHFTDIFGLQFDVRDDDCVSMGIEAYLQVWESFSTLDILHQICNCSVGKDKLVAYVHLQEYAKDKQFPTVLLEEDVDGLWKLL